MPYENTYNNGPYAVARLLAGLPVHDKIKETLDTPWKPLADALEQQSTNRTETFENIIATHPNASSIREQVFAIDPESDPPVFEIAANIQQIDCPPLPAHVQPPGEYQHAPISGWLADYIHFASEAAPMSDVAFHLSCGLFLLATATARRVYLGMGVQKIFTNMYMLLVAHSTLYHKTTALNLCQAVLNAAGLDPLLLASRHTPESLATELGTAQPASYKSWPEDEKAYWLEERRFSAQRGWLLDEASHLLDSFNRDYSAGLLPLILNLYDCPERETSQTISRGRQTIQHAYLSVLGATTPAALSGHLNHSAHWSNGLWARFNMIIPETDFPTWSFFPEPTDVPDDLSDRLTKLARQSLPTPKLSINEDIVHVSPVAPISIELGPGVFEAWECYAKAIGHTMLLSGVVDPQFFPSYGRLYITAMKIAMLIATADWSETSQSNMAPVVTRYHWYQAQNITERWRFNLHKLLNQGIETREQTLESKIIRCLRQAGSDGLTVRELTQRAHTSRPDIENALDSLIIENLIESTIRNNQRTPRYKLS